MKLVNWKSNNNVFDIFDNFDRYFNNIVQDNYRYATPSVNISDNDKKYSLSLDMPGVNKKDIELTVDDGIMTIKAERKIENNQALYSESSDLNYARSFYIPDDADHAKIKASSNNGVLLIEIPKLSKLKKNIKKIAIS